MWHYYILAAVNVAVISVCLYLHKETIDALNGSIVMRDKWEHVEDDFKETIEIFADIVSASNDIFQIQDVKKELDKLNTIYRIFQIKINRNEIDFKKNLAEIPSTIYNKKIENSAINVHEKIKNLRNNIEVILQTSNKYLAEIQLGNKENANVYLAKNHQLNIKANSDILECLRLINVIENNHIKHYKQKADGLKLYKFFLILTIAAIVLLSIAFGVFLSRRMIKDSKNIESYNKKLIDTIRTLESTKEENNNKIMQIRNFIAYACSSFRIPVGHILNYTNVSSKKLTEIGYLQNVESIRLSANSLLQSIKGVLDFIKLESGALSFDVNTFNIGQAIFESLNYVMPEAIKKQINVCIDLVTSINQLVIGDKIRLQQAFVNLISNSVKFTSIGTVGIKVSADKIDQELINFTVVVQDTGIGIPEDKQAVIFEKFKNTDENNNGGIGYGGIGLGLITAKEIISLMGGSIAIKSKEGEGSVFTITIPLKEQSLAPRIQKLDIPLLVISDNDLNKQFLEPSLNEITQKATFLDQIDELSKAEANAIIFISPALANLSSIPKVLENRSRNIFILDFINQEETRKLCEEEHFAGYLHHPLTGEMIYKAINLITSEENAGEFVDNKRLLKKEKLPPIGGDELSLDKEYNILVAEDNIINQEIIKAILNKLGVIVSIAQNGNEAFALFKKNKYDLIFMDTDMPELNGIAATILIREYEVNNALEQITIVACTGNVSETIHKSCHDAGMDDVIIKPMRINEIFEKITKWCN